MHMLIPLLVSEVVFWAPFQHFEPSSSDRLPLTFIALLAYWSSPREEGRHGCSVVAMTSCIYECKAAKKMAKKMAKS